MILIKDVRKVGMVEDTFEDKKKETFERMGKFFETATPEARLLFIDLFWQRTSSPTDPPQLQAQYEEVRAMYAADVVDAQVRQEMG